VENNRLTRAFTEDAFQTLEIIGLSAAGRLELSRKAATDGLTGLYNHDYFRTILNKEFQQARRKSRPLSLAMVDIDHFKQFNDSWGHQAGDHVLREVTLTIQSCCRESDTAARSGGEEIALILPETDAATALSVTERIRAQVAAQVIVYNGQQMSVTVSIGIASLTDATHDHTMLLKRADEALYSSKREGRNRVSAA
jgi:diguanylate cyclase (GGDEF)-like protein